MEGDGELTSAFSEAHARGAAAWPEVVVDPARFEAYLRERAGVEATVARLRALPVEDLYLVCGCLAGDARAATAFHRVFLDGLPTELERVDIPPSIAREVQGVLRERLFAPPKDRPDAPSRLADYGGTGELRGWLHVVAVREALGLLRKNKREVELPDPLLEAIPATGDDPELAHLKSLYQGEFKEAFAEALRVLLPRERNLLRHQFVYGLNIDQLGSLYDVHRATAARWVDAARVRLATETHQRLMVRLKIDRAEVESILRLIRSQLDVSVRQYLGGTEEGPEDGPKEGNE